MLLAVFLLFFYARDNLISVDEGLIFFLLYLFYIYWLYKRSSNESVDEVEENTSFVFLLGGLIGLLFGAQITVNAAVSIAEPWEFQK